jgi:putative aminopeptidase FrvX
MKTVELIVEVATDAAHALQTMYGFRCNDIILPFQGLHSDSEMVNGPKEIDF